MSSVAAIPTPYHPFRRISQPKEAKITCLFDFQMSFVVHVQYTWLGASKLSKMSIDTGSTLLLLNLEVSTNSPCRKNSI